VEAKSRKEFRRADGFRRVVLREDDTPITPEDLEDTLPGFYWDYGYGVPPELYYKYLLLLLRKEECAE